MRCAPEKIRKAMEALPDGFVDTEENMRLAVGGECFWLAFGGSRRVANGGDRARLSLAAADPLAKELIDFRRREKATRDERATARREADAVLASVSSLARLLEVWPAVESFTGDIAASGKQITALAVPIKSLNKVLGLPPGDMERGK